MEIKFGTDGWRGVIGRDFTFENVRRCTQGVVNMLREQGLGSGGLVVGYDTRFASRDFADEVAEVIAGNGIVALVADRPVPTPVVCHNLVQMGADAGIVITASHNPPEWNGFKYKPNYGGSATSKIIANLEQHIAGVQNSNHIKHVDLKRAVEDRLIVRFDPNESYHGHLETLVDMSIIREAGLKIVVDSMHGAGAGYIFRMISGLTKVIEMRSEPNPAFLGMYQPEPIARNLESLMSYVPKICGDIGLATDGDADRLGIVDEHGRFVTTLQSFALLCLHHLEVLGRRGPLVRSITMTGMIDKLGSMYGVPVHITPVGFKHLCPVMIREDALAAGEESGGYAFRGNIPERDGILSALIVLEMIAKTGKSISELLDMLQQKVGTWNYDRWDLDFDEKRREEIRGKIDSAQPQRMAGMRVQDIDMRDGTRFVLEGGYWVLVRFSGTEPLLRIYAESETEEHVQALLTEARGLTGL